MLTTIYLTIAFAARILLGITGALMILYGLCLMIFKKDAIGLMLVIPGIMIILFEVFVAWRPVNFVMGICLIGALIVLIEELVLS